MYRALVDFGQPAVCVLLLTGLAACGGEPDQGNNTTTSSVNSAISQSSSSDTSSSSSSSSSSTSTAPTSTSTAPTSTSVTLSWTAPTQNTDGSALTDLSGYKIVYGTQSGQYTQTIAIDNASLTRYVIDNLSTGTYYFAMKTVTSTGTESALSGEVTKTL